MKLRQRLAAVLAASMLVTQVPVTFAVSPEVITDTNVDSANIDVTTDSSLSVTKDTESRNTEFSNGKVFELEHDLSIFRGIELRDTGVYFFHIKPEKLWDKYTYSVDGGSTWSKDSTSGTINGTFKSTQIVNGIECNSLKVRDSLGQEVVDIVIPTNESFPQDATLRYSSDTYTVTLSPDGTLTISGTGYVTGLHPAFYKLHSRVKRIVVEEGITGLGGYSASKESQMYVDRIEIPSTLELLEQGPLSFVTVSEDFDLTGAVPDNKKLIVSQNALDGTMFSSKLSVNLDKLVYNSTSSGWGMLNRNSPYNIVEELVVSGNTWHKNIFDQTKINKVILDDSVRNVSNSAFNNTRIDTLIIGKNVANMSGSFNSSYNGRAILKIYNYYNKNQVVTGGFDYYNGNTEFYCMDSNTNFREYLLKMKYQTIHMGEPDAYDDLKPVISGVSKVLNDDRTVTLTIFATDNVAGSLQYSINGGSYQSSNIFNVSANGSYTVTVKDASGNVSDPYTIVVDDIKQVDSFKIKQSDTTLEVDRTVKLDVTVTERGNNKVTWRSSNNSVATVSSTGLVTALSEGEVFIEATLDGTNFSDSIIVTVVPKTDNFGSFDKLAESRFGTVSDRYKEIKEDIAELMPETLKPAYKDFETVKQTIERDPELSPLERLALMKTFDDKYSTLVIESGRKNVKIDDDTQYRVKDVFVRNGSKYDFHLSFLNSDGAEIAKTDTLHSSSATLSRAAIVPNLTDSRYITAVMYSKLFILDTTDNSIRSVDLHNEYNPVANFDEGYIYSALNATTYPNGNFTFFVESKVKQPDKTWHYTFDRIDFDYGTGSLTATEIYDDVTRPYPLHTTGVFNLEGYGLYISHLATDFATIGMTESEDTDVVTDYAKSKAMKYMGSQTSPVSLVTVYNTLSKSTNEFDKYISEKLLEMFPLYEDRVISIDDLLDLADHIPGEDKTAPVIESITKNEDNWTNKPVKVSINATDDRGLADEPYSFDGGNTWQNANYKDFASNESFKVVVKDLADNTIEQDVEVANIDIDMPVINNVITDPVTFPTLETKATVTVDAEDVVSGIGGYSFDDGLTWQDSNESTIYRDTLVRVKVKDKAGNIVDYGQDINVDVTEPEGFLINGGNKKLMVSETIKLDYTLTPNANVDITWTVGDRGIASIDKDGKLTGLDVGTTTVTASVNGTTLSDTVNVTVSEFNIPVTSFDITQDEIDLLVGDRVAIDYTINPVEALNTKVDWTSSDASVATVANNKIIAIKSGTVVVTGTTVDGGFTDSIIVNILSNNKEIKSIEMETPQTAKKEYFVGDTFSPTGNLIVNYTDGSFEVLRIVPNMVTYFDTSAAGDSFVQLTYLGKTLEYDIKVNEKLASEISISADYDNTSMTNIAVINVEAKGDVAYIEMPNGSKVNKRNVKFTTRDNGTYIFTAYGEDGKTFDSVVVNVDNIDTEAPIITFHYLKDNLTDVTVNVIDDNFDKLYTPDGGTQFTVPYSFDATYQAGTFTAFDTAGNKTSKDFFVNNISIEGSTSHTYVALDGIPDTWTNKNVTVRVGAQNQVDGIDSILVNGKSKQAVATLDLDLDVNTTTGSAIDITGNSSTDVVVNEAIITSNGVVPYDVTNKFGSYTGTLNIDKIDKVAPTVEYTLTYEDGKTLVDYIVSDDLSGVRTIQLPNGEIVTVDSDMVSSKSGTFELDADGEFEILVEDYAGNITTKTLEAKSNPDANPNPPDGSDGLPMTPILPEGGGDNGDGGTIPPTDGDGDSIPMTPILPDGDNGDGGTKPPTGGDNGNGDENNGGDNGNGGTTPPTDGGSNGGSGSGSNSGSGSGNGSTSVSDSINKAKDKLQFTLPVGEVDLAKALGLKKSLMSQSVFDVVSGVQTITFKYDGKEFTSKVEGVLTEGTPKGFNDVTAKHWAHDDIQSSVTKGYLVGVNESNYMPKATLTFADAFMAVNRVLMINEDLSMKNSRSYVDSKLKGLNKEHWAYYSVASIMSKIDKELVEVLSENKNLYETEILRSTFSEVLFEILKSLDLKPSDKEVKYNDILNVTEAIEFCTRAGILEGDHEGNFNANDVLTRAELAAILIRLDNLFK